jgi:anthranilate synthase component 1
MSSNLIAFPPKASATVPLFIESFLADAITPVVAFQKIRHLSKYAFLFESSEADSRLARFSIVGVDPKETLIFSKGKVEIIDHLSSLSHSSSLLVDLESDPLSFLESRSLAAPKPEQASLPSDFPFVAGYVGFLSYNAVSCFEAIPRQESDTLEVPDGIFSLFDALLIFDHKERTLHVVSMRSEEHVSELIAHLECPSYQKGRNLSSRVTKSVSTTDVKASMSKEAFLSRVNNCKQFIEEGQVFQIVLAQRFFKSFDGDAFDIYRALQSINPSPYGYFLQFPDFSYLGASPERLLSSRNGQLSLSALAGTRPRGRTAEEEVELEIDLRSDEKEMAEHMMLVDLGRNDLGRVAKPGSVQCGEIARITRYGQVMHLTTDISAQLASSSSSFDAARSCFPAGTVSGAPKIRAMELLSELEPETRGIYSGLVGYFDLFGNMDSAIAIRSALVKDGEAHVTAGAGIVQDSIPEKEYEETRSKAASVLKAIAMAEAMQ